MSQKILVKINLKDLGMVVHRCYPTAPEAEAGRLLSSRSVRSCPKTKVMLKIKHYYISLNIAFI